MSVCKTSDQCPFLLLTYVAKYQHYLKSNLNHLLHLPTYFIVMENQLYLDVHNISFYHNKIESTDLVRVYCSVVLIGLIYQQPLKNNPSYLFHLFC